MTKEVKQYDDGEYYLEFTNEELECVGWKEGDTIVWNDNGNGTYTLTKKEDNEHLQSEV